jgi:hypothetical protein
MDNPSLCTSAQRNGLFGLPLGLVALTVLRCGVEERRPAAFATAGVLVGAVPLANGFAFVVPLAIALAWAAMDPRRPGWRVFVPALALGLPVAGWLQPAESVVRWFLRMAETTPSPGGLGPQRWTVPPATVAACLWRAPCPGGWCAPSSRSAAVDRANPSPSIRGVEQHRTSPSGAVGSPVGALSSAWHARPGRPGGGRAIVAAAASRRSLPGVADLSPRTARPRASGGRHDAPRGV